MKTFFLLFVLMIIGTNSAIAQWQKVNTTFKNKIWDMIVSGNSLIAAADSGIYQSTNGGITWVAKNKGLPSTYLSCFVVTSVNGILYAGSNLGAYKSTDIGESWQKVGTSSGAITAIVSNGNTILIGGQSSLIGFIMLSTDNGTTWKNSGFLPEVTGLVLHNNVFIAGTSEGILLSTDGGNTWKPKQQFYSDMYSLVQQGNKVIGGSYSGKVIVTDDDFATWQEYSVINTTSIVNKLCAGTDIVFASIGQKGVFVSKDGGKTWTAANAGLSSSTITMIKILDGKVYISTSDGAYAASEQSFGGATAVNEDNSPLGDMQISPNPSVEYITIHVQGNEGLGYVQLYSIMGEKLLNLQQVEGNTYSVNISSLAAGTYYVRSSSGTAFFVKQ